MREERFRTTKANIAARIARVCVGMDRAEFEALVDRMATVQIKYSTRRAAELLMPEPWVNRVH